MKPIIIHIKDGLADVVQKPKGVTVYILDSDNAIDNDGIPTCDTLDEAIGIRPDKKLDAGIVGHCNNYKIPLI